MRTLRMYFYTDSYILVVLLYKHKHYSQHTFEILTNYKFDLLMHLIKSMESQNKILLHPIIPTLEAPQPSLPPPMQNTARVCTILSDVLVKLHQRLS